MEINKKRYQIKNLLKINRNLSTIQIVVIGGIVYKLRNFVQSHLQAPIGNQNK